MALFMNKRTLLTFLFLTVLLYELFAQPCTTLGQTPATAFPVCVLPFSHRQVFLFVQLIAFLYLDVAGMEQVMKTEIHSFIGLNVINPEH